MRELPWITEALFVQCDQSGTGKGFPAEAGEKRLTPEERKKREDLILALMDSPMYRPMRLRDIAAFLEVSRERRGELSEVLGGLVEKGRVRLSRHGRYSKPEKRDLAGIFAANPRGFGFVRCEGQEEDIFIPRSRTHGALNGDAVRITLRPGQHFHRSEGAVLEVLRHANEKVVGYYRKVRDYGIVTPDDPRITRDVFIPDGKSMGAVTGHKVVCRITRFPHDDGELEGEVTEILGRVTDPGTDILSIVRAYDLPEQFPEDVLAEAARVSEGGVTEAMLSGRRDLTGIQVITIDGEDAKDLDDAVSLEVLDGGSVRLGVHIADVSCYVREGSALDREAYRRGTSVYLADRVISMLPRALSNGICSLNEGEVRLTLTCSMVIDQTGTVTDHEIFASFIRSAHRMTYQAVNEILEGRDPELLSRYADIVPMLKKMNETAELLRNRRRERGSIDFDFPETKVSLDERGRVLDIHPYERNAATRLIEDFMLAANETVAEEYHWREVPFLYRVHDKPDPEKMRELAVFVSNFGLVLRSRNGEIHPKEIQKLLQKAEGMNSENLVSRMALRSMKKAFYSVECTGHFGLAARYYTHFTSPIRRYPDLQIHRIIREQLRGRLTPERIRHYEAVLPEAAEQSSALERRAEEAERESIRYKMCEYMESRVGQVFDGVISGAARFGLFVELPNTVEGMIRIEDLPHDQYEFNEHEWELFGFHTRRRYRLGDRVRVAVKSADRLTRTIDFVPADETEKEEFHGSK